MEILFSIIKLVDQFIAAVPLPLLVALFVFGSFERTYQSNKREKLCFQVCALNGFLLLYTLSFLIWAKLGSFVGVQLASFDWLSVDVPLLMTYNEHATLTFPPMIVLVLLGMLSLCGVSIWQSFQDHEKEDQESLIGLLLLGTGLAGSQQVTSGTTTGSRDNPVISTGAPSQSSATKAGKSKSSSSDATVSSRSITPDITSAGGGPVFQVSRGCSANEILIQDGGFTPAQYVGGNLYRSVDGRVWTLEPSGMTARHVAMPSHGFMNDSSTSGGAGGSPITVSSGSIGAGIAILPLLVIGGLAFAFFCIVTFYIVAVLLAVGTAIILPFVIIDVEKMLLRCYAQLRSGMGSEPDKR